MCSVGEEEGEERTGRGGRWGTKGEVLEELLFLFLRHLILIYIVQLKGEFLVYRRMKLLSY
jgi:hypothetical protein